MKPDFRFAYQDHQREVVNQLRAGGRVRLASGLVDASRLTDRKIADIALRDAEMVVNMAIIQYNEGVERNARK